MKKLIFAILLIGLVGCGMDRKYLRFDETFVVIAVKYSPHYENCIYEGNPQHYNINTYFKPALIIAPCGLYQIGDTIKLNK